MTTTTAKPNLGHLTSVDTNQHSHLSRLIWVCTGCLILTKAFKRLLINDVNYDEQFLILPSSFFTQVLSYE